MNKIVVLYAILVWACPAQAQQKKPDKSFKDIRATVDSTGNKLKNIFSKKKKKEGTTGETGNTQAGSNEVVAAGASQISTKAGSLHADVKQLDNIGPWGFKEGVLIVYYNGLYMLIDTSGKIVIPYSRNYLAYIENGGGSKNFFLYEEDGSYAGNGTKNSFLINNSGKKIFKKNTDPIYVTPVAVSREAQYFFSFDKEYLLMKTMDGAGAAVNSNGEKSRITDAYGFLSEGLVVASISANDNRGTGSLYGFKNLKDQWVIKPIYEELGPFSEGLAVAGKRNAMGDIKYGFIDRTGKEVIPFKYSVRPGSFRYGRAIIRSPLNSTSGIAYACIDKKGETVYEVTQKDINSKQAVVTLNAGYVQGLMIDAFGVVDLNGKWMDIKAYTKSIGLPEGAKIVPNRLSKMVTTSSRDLLLFPATTYEYNPDYLIYEGANSSVSRRAYGIYWMKTKKIVPPVFEQIGEVDPLSKLCYAKFRLKPGTGADAIREGFINQEGEFMFVKKLPSDW